jgi:tetratricopeptide (TPR) repeat protein
MVVSSTGGARQIPDVAVREEPLTLPHYVKAVVPGTENDRRPKYETRLAEDATYRSVVMENEYLRVQLLPELGGVVHRAVFRPTGDDLFYCEGVGKEWYVFWESGVKASFPWAEHGMVNWGQPASWRVYRRADGSATVAMWMEFSRNRERNQHGNTNRVGGYSVCLVSQLVTLAPGLATFSITYRLVNPSPWRQGRRLWNDAFLPRNHTARGAVQGFDLPPETTTSELILPCSYVSYHCGQKFRRWDPEDAKIGERPEAGDSIFPWDTPLGFAGVYYPEARVSRLRLTDPKAAPGAKIYVERRKLALPEGAARLGLDCNYNFIELWGGTDSVFEGVENWLGPGEAFQFTHAFALARGIGKVSFADEELAVSVDFEAPRRAVGVVPWRAAREVALALDGQALPRTDAEGPSAAPDRPATFALPGGATCGVVTVALDGREVLRRWFPLLVPDDTSGHERILRGLKAPRDMFADQRDRNWGVSGAQEAAGRYPDGSTDRGRVLYRLGRVDEALACLTKAAEASPSDGEAHHLRGVALLEQGRVGEAAAAFASAAGAEDPYAPARYYLAVLALGRNDPTAARAELAALSEAVPRHWEARLLAAHLDGSLSLARQLESEDPADPRAVRVLLTAARRSGDARTAAEAGAALDALLAEPGAAARLAEFEAATRGRYVAPARLLRAGEAKALTTVDTENTEEGRVRTRRSP